MKRGTKTREAADQPEQPVGVAAGRGSSQTGLRALGAKSVTVLALGALACGPLALVVAMSSVQVKPAAAQPSTVAEISPRQQSAGEYGAAFVAAWLRATRSDPSPLKGYIEESSIQQLSDEAWEYRDLTVVSIEQAGGGALTSVVVAANVKELDTSAEEAVTIWPRRYFAVAVRAGEDGLGVVGLPAPVAAPGKSSTPVKLAYTEAAMDSAVTKDTVEAFLNAYLAGSGDVSRYVTPGSDIAAVTPAPYEVLKVTDLISDVTPSETPSTGAVMHVLATVELRNAMDQQLTSTYALTLTARDGRWETTSVDLTPLEATTKKSSPSR